MQLEKKDPIRTLLAAATCALLSSHAPESGAAQEVNADMSLDASYMDYREKDRVKVREVDLNFKWYRDDDTVLSGKFINDSITGSTPSGAVRPMGCGASETLTSPSGVSGGTGTGAGCSKFQNPLASFIDRRVALIANWETAHTRVMRSTFTGSISNEDDYKSFGGGASVAHDLNQKLTTLEAGIGLSYDYVGKADGSVPPELGDITNTRYDYEDGEKLTFDRSVAITQVLTRQTVAKASFSNGSVSGYLTDPYKIITLIDQDTREPKGYFYEKRPRSRTRNSLNLDLVTLHNEKDVVSAYYRYYWDTWDIRSHTLDLHVRIEHDGNQFFQPHVRYYRQSAADFYMPFLDESKGQDPGFGNNAPANASADYRLDQLSSFTLGLTYGIGGRLGEFRARYEFMKQIGNEGDYRILDARFLQLTYSLTVK